MSQIVIGGIYRHYKNKRYRVLSVAKHTETLEDLVVYETLYENKVSSMWVRPLAMFLEQVSVNGYSGPRFLLESTNSIEKKNNP
jgi:hypothetical protein